MAFDILFGHKLFLNLFFIFIVSYGKNAATTRQTTTLSSRFKTVTVDCFLEIIVSHRCDAEQVTLFNTN